MSSDSHYAGAYGTADEVFLNDDRGDVLDAAAGPLGGEAQLVTEEVDYFDRPASMMGSGPSSEHFISKNVDYTQRDGDGNPTAKAVTRTWSQWFKHWKPCFLICMFSLFKAMSTTLTAPIIPFLLVEYYADGSDAKTDVDAAEKQAASVQTYFDATRALLAFLVVPLYGTLMDNIGRRPFFIMVAILGTLPPAMLFALPRNPLYYVVFNEIAQIFSGSYLVAFIADVYEERERAAVYAVQTGVAGLGSFIAVLAPGLGDNTLFIGSLTFALLRIPLAFFFIRETLPTAQRKTFSLALINPNPMPCLRFIMGQKVLRMMTLIIGLLVVSEVGTTEILPYYLIQKVGLTQSDNFIMALEFGLTNPLMNLVVYRILSAYVRPTRIVFIAFTMLILGVISLMVATHFWMIWAISLPMLGGIFIGTPSLIGIFSNAGTSGSQGMRMAGIMAVMDLISAITPLAIGAIFHGLPTNLNFLSFAICLLFSIPALPMVWHWLPKWIAADRDEQIQKSFSSHQRIAGGDETGDLGPNGLAGMAVAEVARLAASEAEEKEKLLSQTSAA